MGRYILISAIPISMQDKEWKYLCSSLLFGSGKVSATAKRRAMTRDSLPSTPTSNHIYGKWGLLSSCENYYEHVNRRLTVGFKQGGAARSGYRWWRQLSENMLPDTWKFFLENVCMEETGLSVNEKMKLESTFMQSLIIWASSSIPNSFFPVLFVVQWIN